MTRRAYPSLVLRCALVGAAAGTGLCATAQAQSQWSVDVGAGAGISTNPYQQVGAASSGATFTGNVSVRPSLVIQRPTTTLTLDGNAAVAFYGSDYGANESFALSSGVQHKLSERTTLTGSLGYFNSILGSYNDVRVPVGQPVIESQLPVNLTDPALGVLGRRQESYQGAVGLGSLLSPRDRVNVNLAASATRLGGVAYSDFNYLSPSASYSRAVGEGFDIGASMSVGFTNYLRTRIGDATVYQPQLTASRRLGSRWTIDLAAGAGIASVRNANGTTTNSTSFNGSATLCRRDDRWNACFSASRQTVPSTFQGVRTQTSVSASVGHRLGPNDDLSLSASYSRAGAPVQQNVIGGVRDGGVDYISANGSLSHRFGRALSGFVSLGVANGYERGINRSANFTALAGLSYRFGPR